MYGIFLLSLWMLGVLFAAWRLDWKHPLAFMGLALTLSPICIIFLGDAFFLFAFTERWDPGFLLNEKPRIYAALAIQTALGIAIWIFAPVVKRTLAH